jgi:hypothetical protein
MPAASSLQRVPGQLRAPAGENICEVSTRPYQGLSPGKRARRSASEWCTVSRLIDIIRPENSYIRNRQGGSDETRPIFCLAPSHLLVCSAWTCSFLYRRVEGWKGPFNSGPQPHCRRYYECRKLSARTGSPRRDRVDLRIGSRAYRRCGKPVGCGRPREHLPGWNRRAL